MARYTQLLRGLPGCEEAELDPAVWARPPSALLIGSGGPAEKAEAAEVVRRALGPQLAKRVQAERARPALDAALRRAQRGGHDLVALLNHVARSRELKTARSVSEVLAWRIGTYLATGYATATGNTESRAQKVDPQTWATLAWRLKTAENNGCNLAEAVASVSTAPDPVGALISVARAAQKPVAQPMPPWISEPVPASQAGPEADRQIAEYLDAAAEAIRKRVHMLAVDAARARPAWVQVLGSSDRGHARHDEWLRLVGVVAAYRDQYQITSDDPRQVLGPYAELGTLAIVPTGMRPNPCSRPGLCPASKPRRWYRARWGLSWRLTFI